MLCKNLNYNMLETLRAIPLDKTFMFKDIGIRPPNGVIQRLREEHYITRISRDPKVGSTWRATDKVNRVINR